MPDYIFSIISQLPLNRQPIDNEPSDCVIVHIYSIDVLPSGSEQHEVLLFGSIKEGIL